MYTLYTKHTILASLFIRQPTGKVIQQSLERNIYQQILVDIVSVENAVSVENKPVVQVKKFVCDLCEKGFDKEGPLANHRIHVQTLRTKKCSFFLRRNL